MVRGKKKKNKQISNVLKLLWSCSKRLKTALNILWLHAATQEGMEESIFKNVKSSSSREGFSHCEKALSWGKSDHTPLPSHFPHSFHTCPSPGQFSAHPSIHPSINLSISYQLYMPTSSSPTSPYPVTILKGTLLDRYIPYSPLKHMFKKQRSG